MRIALFSDIHGNLTGLRAVLNKLDQLGGSDTIIAAGDFIAGCSATDEIIDLLQEREAQLVFGDSDSEAKLLQLIDGSHPGADRFPTGYYRAMHEWLQRNLSPHTWQFLESLPVLVRIECAPGHSLLVCHAAPDDPGSRSCSPDLPPAQLMAIYADEEAEVVAFGHAHNPHVRWLDGRLYVNVASVAFQPDSVSVLTILNCLDGPAVSRQHGRANWTVEQHMVPFDADLELKRMRQRGVPVPEDFNRS